MERRKGSFTKDYQKLSRSKDCIYLDQYNLIIDVDMSIDTHLQYNAWKPRRRLILFNRVNLLRTWGHSNITDSDEPDEPAKFARLHSGIPSAAKEVDQMAAARQTWGYQNNCDSFTRSLKTDFNIDDIDLVFVTTKPEKSSKSNASDCNQSRSEITFLKCKQIKVGSVVVYTSDVESCDI
ncbi:hypothetical protein Bhyg_11554 [Pseudolycoriella hygida]|uniref:Uncharacterized protein n=1 Tax=Pseudolycoriella hygida TaxID=35572 RepID=A0A9Q0MVM9_9DIPT|nr:hypothetical protein Bhyg_11554 [Pseudolycoriella hygida]